MPAATVETGAGAAAAANATASAIVPAAPGTMATTTPPGQAVVDPASYQPKTEFDNTPWRFNMEQDGKRMTADEFTAWMEARGVRVARGAARPVAAQNPTGDGRPPNWSSATAGQVGEAGASTTIVTTPATQAEAQAATTAASTAAATESVAVPATPVPTTDVAPDADDAEAQDASEEGTDTPPR
ncbi:hypothetical protein GCM10028862_12260 [Luteimonas pelagia]